MIKQITYKPRIRKIVKKYIKNIPLLQGGEWDSLKNDPYIIEFKKTLREQLEIYQEGQCAFCGLKLNETGRTEIEHIAPKGGAKRPRYAQYTFTIHNLVLACNLCNSPLKKGQKDTINNYDPNNKNYRAIEFNIFHPYFDNPIDHFKLSANGAKIIITPCSDKGKRTISVFDLNNEPHCEARAKALIYEIYSKDPKIESMLELTLKYKGY